MSKISDFTEGKIFSPLLKFALPVLLAMFLQAMYGAVDLFVVGRFGTSADVSAVSTGSQTMLTVTAIVNGFAMGLTILLGQKLGEGKKREAGDAVGSGICIFSVMAVIFTVLMVVFTEPICRLMNAPSAAFDGTAAYVRICSAGSVFIIAYNAIGGIFRGLGDSKTPLITVGIACVVNIVGDLILVAGFHMAAAGAALATILAQAVSVVLGLIIIKKRGLPFEFSKKCIRFDRSHCSRILKYGSPIALQDFLVHMSFLVILMIVNDLGVTASAGVGVSEKVVGFILLSPRAFSQAVASFVAQNYGARKLGRARLAMLYAIAASFLIGLVMFYISFYHGDVLAGIFSHKPEDIAAAHSYMKAFSFDCLLTAFMFCMVGYFNGCGKTTFVMVQGIIGAFGVRIPVSYYMSLQEPVSLFHIGLATPASTCVQILLCLGYFALLSARSKKRARRLSD